MSVWEITCLGFDGVSFSRWHSSLMSVAAHCVIIQFLKYSDKQTPLASGSEMSLPAARGFYKSNWCFSVGLFSFMTQLCYHLEWIFTYLYMCFFNVFILRTSPSFKMKWLHFADGNLRFWCFICRNIFEQTLFYIIWKGKVCHTAGGNRHHWSVLKFGTFCFNNMSSFRQKEGKRPEYIFMGLFWFSFLF